ncbi:MAG: tetratricopeptide repeat protein [Pseudomonadota bacterium]
MSLKRSWTSCWAAAIFALAAFTLQIQTSSGDLRSWPLPGLSSVAAAEPVKVRGGRHDTYARLVFEWPAPVPYEAYMDGKRLIITFGKQAQFDAQVLVKALPNEIAAASLSPDGVVVTVTLKKAMGLKDFTLDKRIVIDLTDDPADGRSTKKKKPGREAIQVAEKSASDETKKVAVGTSKAVPQAAKKNGRAETQKASSRPVNLVGEGTRKEAKAAVPKVSEDEVEKQSAEAVLVSAVPQADFEIRRRARDEAQSPVLGRAAAAVMPLELQFTWHQSQDRPVAAAGFRHAGYLWLVFDRPAPPDIIEKIAAARTEIAGATLIPAPHATVLRLETSPLISPRFSREGDSWVVDLRARSDSLEQVATVDLAKDGADGLIRISAPDRGRMIWLTDPHSGQRLVVIPSAQAGIGLPARHSFAQFEALTSQQGVVLSPLSQGIEVANAKSGILVRDQAGLRVSGESARNLMPRDLAATDRGRRLFDLTKWRITDRSGFTEVKQDLLHDIVDVPGEDRTIARWRLARFYFAWGLARETLGLLRVIENTAPRMASDPEFVLMRGASHFMLRNYDAAAEHLNDPVLSNEWEAKPWQGALLAAAQDWEPAAGYFAESHALFAAYPRQVRNRLRLLAAEARIGIHDSGGASAHLVKLSRDELDEAEAAQAKYLTGRRFHLDGERDLARQLWRELANDNHRASQARARLGLLDMALEDEEISKEEAVEALERLRFAWRGDTFEMALLSRLAAIYRKNGNYRKALITMRQTASNFPRSPEARAITEQMSDLFAELFLTEQGDSVPPLRALSLYEEFKELTPPGDRGDAIITRLADRLVEVDLLPQAAELMEEQVQFRLQGTEKARAGNRLALIYLMDDKAEQSLGALAESAVAEMPAELAQERRLLRARGLAALQQNQEALALLKNDDSPKAVRLVGEIKWQMRDWIGAAKALDRQIPQDPPDRALTETESQRVVNLAMALTLADDRVRLIALNKRYQNAMAQGPHRDLFRLLASGIDPNGARSIAEGLGQVDTVQAFLSSYKEGAGNGATTQ